MKYALLIYQDAEFERFWAAASDAERAAVYARFDAFTTAAGDRLLGGEELALSGTATTVRTRDGEVVLSDGPFAEVSEHLGGFLVLDAGDLDEVIGLVRLLPEGTVEIRPIQEPPAR
jgi:hypothetical protein